MIKTVIFDLDDTLYDYKGLHHKAMKALEDYMVCCFHVAPESFRLAFSAAREETKRDLRNTAASHNRMLYCQKTLEQLELSPVLGALEMYEVYWNYLLQHMKLQEGAGEILDICKQRGIKIGICSDLTAHIQHRKIQALRIEDSIDAIVTSEEVGAEKPDPRMFQMILKKLNGQPETALFIGDSLEKDILGAENVGMQALWLGGNSRENAITSFFEIRKFL